MNIISRKGAQSKGCTLDRVNATLGYVKGNVAVISRKANTLKGNATAGQHRRIAEWMESVS